MVGQVRRPAMADGDGGIGLQEQQRHRFAHGIAAPDNHRVFAAHLEPGAFDHFHATIRGAGEKSA